MNPLAAVEPWDLVAEGYAQHALAIMEQFSQIAVDTAGLTESSRIVDVAAGPGTLSLLAAPQVAQVRSVDFSEQMVAQLRAAIAERGIANVYPQVGDGQDLPFGAGEFDAGFSMFGLMFFPDRARGFAELFRVLRPGGIATVSSWAPVAQSPMMQLTFQALAAADPDSDGAPPESVMDSLENPERFAEEMRAAGFTQVRVVPHSRSMTYPSAAAIWERMTRSSAPLIMLRRKLGEQVWAERSALIVDYLEQHYRPGTKLATTAYLGTGVKPEA